MIVIKDAKGVEQQYEVFEESEEEASVTVSVDRQLIYGEDGTVNLNVRKSTRGEGEDSQVTSNRKRVMIEGDNFDNESFFIEEIIEESEEETDEEEGFSLPQSVQVQNLA